MSISIADARPPRREYRRFVFWNIFEYLVAPIPALAAEAITRDIEDIPEAILVLVAEAPEDIIPTAAIVIPTALVMIAALLAAQRAVATAVMIANHIQEAEAEAEAFLRITNYLNNPF